MAAFLAAPAATAAPATACTQVTTVHHGTHLVFAWRTIRMTVHGRVVERRVHVWREARVRVHGKLVERRLPVRVRRPYDWRTTAKRCTPVVAPAAGSATTSSASTTTTAPPFVEYSAVDPTFTQSPTDPLAVTFDYSASATSTRGGVSTDLAATGQLPGGVLNLFGATAPGQPAGLLCSMNVGGSTTGSTCPVTYSAAGTYTITIEYLPAGTAPVTASEIVDVAPYATSAALTLAPPASIDWLDGLPEPGAYTFTASATVTDQNGNTLSTAAGDLSFTVALTGMSPAPPANLSTGTYSTEQPGQTSCALVVYSEELQSTLESTDCAGPVVTTNGGATGMSVVATFSAPGYTASTASASEGL